MKTVYIYFVFSALLLFSLGGVEASQLESAHIKEQEFYAEQYNEVKSLLLDKYKRPFTVLLLGSQSNSIFFNIARDFPFATCIYIDEDRSKVTLQRCVREKRKNVIFIKREINIAELRRLAECEHFDVTIAFNFLRHSDRAKQAIDSLLNMGDHLFIDPLDNIDVTLKSIRAYLFKKKPTVLRSKKLWYIKTSKKSLLRNNWKRKELVNQNKYAIKSTFEEKIFTKEKKGSIIESIWVPGINMETFCHLNGGFPQKGTVARNIEKLLRERKRPNHISLHNMVIQGEKIVFIDIGKKYTNFTGEDKKKFKQLIKRLHYELIC